MRKRKNINIRKRKNIIVLMTVIAMATASLSGCGVQAEAVNNEITDMKEREINEVTDMKEKEITPTVMPEGDNTETVGNATTVIPEKENTENKEPETVETQEPTQGTTITPMPENTAEPTLETTYTEKDSVFLADDKKYKKANAVDEIDFKGMELYYRPYYVTIGQNEINLYQRNGLFAGYTKPGIQMRVFRGDDVWYGVYIDKEVYFIKRDDLNPAITATSEKPIQDDVEYDSLAGGNSETTSKPDTDVKATPEPVTAPEPMRTPEPVETPEVAQPSEPNEPTTYSEDEVIAIVREAMENAGFQWYPDSDEYQRYLEKYPNPDDRQFGPDGGMGWGEGYISMTDPYTDAAGIVEGYQYGKWTMYYLEVLEVSNDKVKIRLYRG